MVVVVLCLCVCRVGCAGCAAYFVFLAAASVLGFVVGGVHMLRGGATLVGVRVVVAGLWEQCRCGWRRGNVLRARAVFGKVLSEAMPSTVETSGVLREAYLSAGAPAWFALWFLSISKVSFAA